MKILTVLAFGICALLLQVSSVSAQTSCLLYPSNSTPPGAPYPYGASWDVTTPGKELLVKSNCPTSGNSITITVGKGDTNQFIWQNSYVYDASLSPPKWATTTLSGTVDSRGWITSGAGTKTITTPFTASASNPLFFVGYVCTYHASRWKCGCANTSCATPLWQLQGYKGTGGGGGTGGSWNGGDFTPPSFYQTIKQNAATMCYNPTNTRSLSPGTSSITQGGTASNPLVYVPTGAFNGGSLNINAQYVVLKGGTFNGTSIRVSASNVRITENTIRVPMNGTGIRIESNAYKVRIDRNILDGGNSTAEQDIMVKVADGTSNPLYHRIDHNLFIGGVGCCLNVYIGDVNKDEESISRTLLEKNYLDRTGRKYGFYTKSTENVIENNVFDGGGPRPGIRDGSRNIFFQNHFKGNTAAFAMDTDNYFVSNVFEGTDKGLWIAAGDCTFSLHDCLAGAGQPNHPVAVRTKVWGNLFKTGSDQLRIGYKESILEGGRVLRCPEGTDLSGNSDLAVGENGCSAPSNQNVNPSVSPALIGLTKSQVGPAGEVDSLCD